LPGSQNTADTTPAVAARTLISIFMASITSSSSSAATCWPGSTRTCHRLPVTGAYTGSMPGGSSITVRTGAASIAGASERPASRQRWRSSAKACRWRWRNASIDPAFSARKRR
jgi:hypothetical protein